MNPNKLSTKVHYAPGGASSLSLAWDDTPNINSRQKSRSQPNNQIQPNYRSANEPTQITHQYSSPQYQQ